MFLLAQRSNEKILDDPFARLIPWCDEVKAICQN